MNTRREFLRGLGGAGVALCGCRWGHAQLAGPNRGPVVVGGRRVRTIDMHAHMLVPEVWSLIEDDPRAESDIGAFLRSPLAPRLTNIEDRLETMQRQGIDMQALTLHFQHQHDWADRPLAGRIVALLNERVAEQVAAFPDQLVGLGTVSLQHPDLAAEQLTHAMRELGLRGVGLTTMIGEEEISSPRFDPFWERAAELDAVVFVHPEGFAHPRFTGEGSLGNTIGMPLDTTVAVSHMIFSGFLDRHPNLNIVTSHGGGYLPSYIGRSDNVCASRGSACEHLGKTPGEYLRQLYYDTLVYSPDVLAHMIGEVGASQLVLGTDYPFPIASRDPVGDALAVSGLSDDERIGILGGTAERLLKL